MATSRIAPHGYLVVSPVGAQAKFSIAAIADDLARRTSGTEAAAVLFDWSQLKSWPFAAPCMAATQEWNKTAPPIARAALIHDRKWDRHAAVLSAVLRIGGAEARSFRLSDREKAIAWLEQANPGAVDIR